MGLLTASGQLLAPLLPAGVAFEQLAIEGDYPPLFAIEEAATREFVPKRRRTFAFGRACARRALRASIAIPVGPGGAPLWPPGVVGSITHTDEVAAAVASTSVRAIGIDLESLACAATIAGLPAIVAMPSERSWPAALVFSAKESVYKCVYPLTGRFLDFQDVELAFGDGTFEVVRIAGYDARTLRGRFAIDADYVATVAVIESEPR